MLLNKISGYARDILSAIVDIGKSLKGLKDAITEAAEATKTQHRPPPEVRFTTEVNLPQGVETRKSATDASDDKKYQRRTLW